VLAADEGRAAGDLAHLPSRVATDDGGAFRPTAHLRLSSWAVLMHDSVSALAAGGLAVVEDERLAEAAANQSMQITDLSSCSDNQPDANQSIPA